MTGPQASYLETLAQGRAQNSTPISAKAEASKWIDELQHETGRSLDY